MIKKKIFLIVAFFLSTVLGEKSGMGCLFAQYVGGDYDGHSLRDITILGTCSPLLSYANINIGGNYDGHSLREITILGTCSSLLSYANIYAGGNYDGYALQDVTILGACSPLLAYKNIFIGGNYDGGAMVAPACMAMLPIELLSFTGKTNGKEHILEWTTATEINNDYFTLERSHDAKSFEKFSVQKGAGNTTTSQKYSITDFNPYSGTSYYRLKQTDFDGRFSYSKNIVVLTLQGIDLISLSPNPADAQFEYLISSSEDTQVNITAIDVLGRKLITQSLLIQKGVNKLDLDITTLSAGLYVLQITTESGLYKIHKQFVKN